MIDFCVEQPGVRHVPDAEYFATVCAMIDTAWERALCSVFIVDAASAHDSDLLVYEVLLRLQAAAWRGADVRLLIGGSRTTFDIAVTAETSRSLARFLGLECRWLTSEDVRGSHAKYVVCDERVLIGSHNWSGGAMSGQVQDSLLLHSATLAEQFGNTFGYQWRRARGSDADVSI